MQERDSRLGLPFLFRSVPLGLRSPGSWQSWFCHSAPMRFEVDPRPFDAWCRLIGNMIYCATRWRGGSASALMGEDGCARAHVRLLAHCLHRSLLTTFGSIPVFSRDGTHFAMEQEVFSVSKPDSSPTARGYRFLRKALA